MTSQASASPRSEICRRLDRTPRVYFLGSSTMGSVLGPMLQKRLKQRWDIKSKRWGKASSGLARPDFHDWPALAPNLMRRHRPDYVVVSLGTNDHQPLKTKKSWIKTTNPRWEKTYKQRVLIMLRRLSGRDRNRTVVWLGPTNFDAKNARKLGPSLNRLIREAIEEFDGPAVFIDARTATSNANGDPGTTYQHPEKGRRPMRAHDGVHLTTGAVRWLLAEPVLKILGDCWDQDVAARDVIRKKRKAERAAKRREAQEARKERAEARRNAAEEARAKRRKSSQKASPKQTTKPVQASDPAATSTKTTPTTDAQTPESGPGSEKPSRDPKAQGAPKPEGSETKATKPKRDCKPQGDGKGPAEDKPKPETHEGEDGKPKDGSNASGKATDKAKTDKAKEPADEKPGSKAAPVKPTDAPPKPKPSAGKEKKEGDAAAKPPATHEGK